MDLLTELLNKCKDLSKEEILYNLLQNYILIEKSTGKIVNAKIKK